MLVLSIGIGLAAFAIALALGLTTFFKRRKAIRRLNDVAAMPQVEPSQAPA